MEPYHDVIVAGLGAMGSATAMHLARRGCSVLGFDRFHPPHGLGSSHGGSRIIREAYFEHPAYVPLVHHAYDLWAALERDSGAQLYLRTGGLMIGAADSDLIVGSLRSAREHRLAHETLDAEEIHRRFPALHPERGMVGVIEPRAGVLFPERCIATMLEQASIAGARLRYDEPIDAWVPDGDGVRVFTRNGEFRARHLVAATGGWIGDLDRSLARLFTIERQALFWFAAQQAHASFAPQNCPIHLWQFDRGDFFYGFPDLGDGRVKLGRHHRGASTTADAIDRTVSASEIEDIRRLVDRFVPDASGYPLETAVCMYTNAPDEHFRVDWLRPNGHPQHTDGTGDSGTEFARWNRTEATDASVPAATTLPSTEAAAPVLVVSACSGHGFKFAPVIGEIAADLVTKGRSRFDLSLFSLGASG